MGQRLGGTVNLGRISKCERCTEEYEINFFQRIPARPRSVIFELADERNALERVLLHFAHFEKQAEKIEDNRFRVTVNYDKDDETEIVIRILSIWEKKIISDKKRRLYVLIKRPEDGQKFRMLLRN